MFSNHLVNDEKLYVIKKPHIKSDDETIKLFKREKHNYMKIKHPFIPKYNGTVDINGTICHAIEFINGRVLSEIDFSQFNVSEKVSVVTQLLLVIEYLHKKKNFIYKNYIEKKYDYTVYFEEAIRQKNDPVSMYFNLMKIIRNNYMRI